MLQNNLIDINRQIIQRCLKSNLIVCLIIIHLKEFHYKAKLEEMRETKK
jgi:hypothetical protein